MRTPLLGQRVRVGFRESGTETMSDQRTRGLETPARREEPTTNNEEPGAGFVCRACGFGASTREEFSVNGLAMACPECSSTRVEHEFGGGRR